MGVALTCAIDSVPHASERANGFGVFRGSLEADLIWEPGVVQPRGALRLTPKATTTYTLFSTNQFGRTTSTATVTVQ